MAAAAFCVASACSCRRLRPSSQRSLSGSVTVAASRSSSSCVNRFAFRFRVACVFSFAACDLACAVAVVVLACLLDSADFSCVVARRDRFGVVCCWMCRLFRVVGLLVVVGLVVVVGLLVVMAVTVVGIPILAVGRVLLWLLVGSGCCGKLRTSPALCPSPKTLWPFVLCFRLCCVARPALAMSMALDMCVLLSLCFRLSCFSWCASMASACLPASFRSSSSSVSESLKSESNASCLSEES